MNSNFEKRGAKSDGWKLMSRVESKHLISFFFLGDIYFDFLFFHAIVFVSLWGLGRAVVLDMLPLWRIK